MVFFLLTVTFKGKTYVVNVVVEFPLKTELKTTLAIYTRTI